MPSRRFSREKSLFCIVVILFITLFLLYCWEKNLSRHKNMSCLGASRLTVIIQTKDASRRKLIRQILIQNCSKKIVWHFNRTVVSITTKLINYYKRFYRIQLPIIEYSFIIISKVSSAWLKHLCILLIKVFCCRKYVGTIYICVYRFTY